MTREPTNKELYRTLTRLETKMVRFAEELGIDIDVDPDWLTVDREHSRIYLTTLGRSLLVIKTEAVKRGAATGFVHQMWFDGRCVGTLYL